MAGCRSTVERAELMATQSYTPLNTTGIDGALPADVVRVAVLPVHLPGYEADLLERLDHSFQSELTKTMRFEVVPVSREAMERHFRKREVNSTEPLPHNLFPELARMSAADAVLFTEVTHFDPYKPMGIGVRSKLVHLSEGTMLWACDSYFDADQPQVIAGAKRFQDQRIHKLIPIEDNESILRSPTRFSEYVAYTLYQTLPPR
ncbi:MAG: hypothetical protein ACOCVG_05050 [Verrucomicrobiota bacterium]